MPDGVWLIELAALADPALVPLAVAAAMGISTELGRPVLDALVSVLSQRRLLGCLTGDLKPNRDFDRYFHLYQQGLLDLDALITGTVPLDQIADGFDRSASGEQLRTVVSMS